MMAIHPDLLAATVLDGHRRREPTARRRPNRPYDRGPLRRWAATQLRRGADALDQPARTGP